MKKWGEICMTVNLNAVISTVKTEIVALTVNNRQMTLAVYRQLLQEDIIDRDTGLLRGTPIGLVNYKLRDCSNKVPGHLHVVWINRDEQLRRCCDYSKIVEDMNAPCGRSEDVLVSLNAAQQEWTENEYFTRDGKHYVSVNAFAKAVNAIGLNPLDTIKKLVDEGYAIRQKEGSINNLSKVYKSNKSARRYYCFLHGLAPIVSPVNVIAEEVKQNFIQSRETILSCKQIFVAL